ncbi:unnamed protein product [Paramecium primaurelia]|uniref:Mitochondrial carrier protein n=1 Tax=Paramecium primaurelia TaxID=5886 RepID=A0A8S1LEW6_PARPR|nr:unnamed protein product [Paramecium primaurelia]
MDAVMNGAIAGATTVLITNPFDLAKTRLQAQGELVAEGHYKRAYSGVINTLIKTSSSEGLLAIQKGLQAAIVFQIIMNGLRFGSYEIVKDIANEQFHLYNSHGYVKVLSNIGISAGVGCFSAFVSSPFNMIKTRLMLQTKDLPCGNRYNYSGLIDAISQIFKLEGLKGLYAGSSIMALRTGLGSAIQLPVFDFTKEHGKQWIKNQTELNMLASANATLWLCLMTCPVEVALTRYFNQQFDKYGNPTVYQGCFHAIKIIFQSEGFLGLYKGLGGLFFRSGPQSFISLLIVNQLNSLRNSKKQ